MMNWRICIGLTLEWRIGHGLTLDWRMGDQLARIGTGLALDYNQIGTGLESDWDGLEFD